MKLEEYDKGLEGPFSFIRIMPVKGEFNTDIPVLNSLMVRQYNKEVKALYDSLDPDEADYMSTYFKESIHTYPYYDKNIAYRLYWIQPSTYSDRPLKGFAETVMLNDDVGYFMLCVSPDARRRGIGEALLRAALTISDLKYNVNVKNEKSLFLAMKIYTQQGENKPVIEWENNGKQKTFHLLKEKNSIFL